MPATPKANAALARPAVKFPRLRIIREILIWNAAWREYRHLQALDAAARADMGLSEADRASVSVAGIAARMRG